MSENSKQEDLSKVIEETEQKCVERPGSVVAHHHLGLVYRKAGRLDEAVVALEKAIELDPNAEGSKRKLKEFLESDRE